MNTTQEMELNTALAGQVIREVIVQGDGIITLMLGAEGERGAVSVLPTNGGKYIRFEFANVTDEQGNVVAHHWLHV